MKNDTYRWSVLTGLWVAGLLGGTVYAHEKDADSLPQVQLETTAQAETTHDIASMTWFFEASDPQPAQAHQNAALAMNAALASLGKDPGVLTRKTQLNTQQTYRNDGKLGPWKARAEIILEGRDFEALSKAAQKLGNGFALAGVQYFLSDEARKKEESRLTEEAIAQFRAKAAIVSKGFGYAGYELGRINVRAGTPYTPQPKMMAMRAMAAEAAPVALEGGTGQVQVSVSGSIYLKR